MYKKYQNKPSQQGLCGEKILNWLDVYLEESFQLITELSYWWVIKYRAQYNTEQRDWVGDWNEFNVPLNT